jgi:ammonia channel protein AmtB
MMIVGMFFLFFAFLGFNEGFRNEINSTLFHVIAGTIGIILIIGSMLGERIFFSKKNLEKIEN